MTEPDMRSADEVVAYLRSLRDILMYLKVCDGNMEEEVSGANPTCRCVQSANNSSAPRSS